MDNKLIERGCVHCPDCRTCSDAFTDQAWYCNNYDHATIEVPSIPQTVKAEREDVGVDLNDITVILGVLLSGEAIHYTTTDCDGIHSAELSVQDGLFVEKWDGKLLRSGYTGLHPYDLQQIAEDLKQTPSPATGANMFDWYKVELSAQKAITHQ